MDGHPMGRTTVMPRRTGSRQGVRTGPTTRVLFRFAPLVVTDDDGLVDPRYANIADLGTIEVRIYRVIKRSDRTAFKFHVVSPPGPIHERSKKAGAHCVALGEEVRCSTQTTTHKATYIDKRNEPYVRFMFHYRPRELLEADGIVPRLSRGLVDHDNRRITRAASKRKLESSGSGSSSAHPNKRRRTGMISDLVIDLSMDNDIPASEKVKREPPAPASPKVMKASQSHLNFEAAGAPDVSELTED
ncbi:hypothetical protein B0H21DRAFT_772555 [Amylocystis lapponica]|nr:hypothetical protein B0H21DRAFT_772555 [Amylocystis lapponica]